MYIPKQFQNSDTEEVKDFINNNGFGILISQVNGKMWATHIPLVLSESGDTLEGHLAKANLQWKNFNNGDEVLVIFQGPHAYISSSWYDHENVPTWNYMAVHVYGTVHLIEGDKLMHSLKRLVDKYERYSAKPVSVENMTPTFLQREINGLVGFEICITRVEAAYKLSQNRDASNHQAIVTALENCNNENVNNIAKAMRKEASKKESSR